LVGWFVYTFLSTRKGREWAAGQSSVAGAEQLVLASQADEARKKIELKELKE
jgi:hypothetical protein